MSYKAAGRVFNCLNLSDRTLVTESTQPLKEMSKMLSPGEEGGKGGQCLGLTPYHLRVPIVSNVWEPQPLGNLRACTGLDSDCMIACTNLKFTISV